MSADKKNHHRGGGIYINGKILRSNAIGALRQRVLAGGDLAMTEVLELLVSHEQLRATVLARQYRCNVLEEENQALIDALGKKTNG
jgi:hypothetical protein